MSASLGRLLSVPTIEPTIAPEELQELSQFDEQVWPGEAPEWPDLEESRCR